MPLSDRIAARRGNAEESPADAAPEAADYETLANDLADHVSRLGAFRGHSDRVRIEHQLTEIDRRVHTLLEYVGARRTT